MGYEWGRIRDELSLPRANTQTLYSGVPHLIGSLSSPPFFIPRSDSFFGLLRRYGISYRSLLIQIFKPLILHAIRNLERFHSCALPFRVSLGKLLLLLFVSGDSTVPMRWELFESFLD
ncbi:hypothetical protein ACLOJK_033237 [Asimina triloba]